MLPKNLELDKPLSVPDSDQLRRSVQRAARRLEAIAAELKDVDTSNLSGDEWLLVRAQIGNLTADFNEGVADVDRILGTTGGQSRILRYFQLRLGEVVTKDELSGVAGIYEWARRVRELRMDQGWAIQSAVTRSDLRTGEYVLTKDHPDEALAHSWSVARSMRNLRTVGGVASPRVRLLEYLKVLYPESADSEQLEYVAGTAAQFVRCMDELLDEGWQIVTGSDDGISTEKTYRLASLERII